MLLYLAAGVPAAAWAQHPAGLDQDAVSAALAATMAAVTSSSSGAKS